MRNLKRALSLTLASVMLLGMMVVGSSAASYPDVEDTHNVEAIEVLQAIKVMVGDDNGNFGPDDQVNRSQMAVVMALLLDLDYDYYKGTNPFWDVPSWAEPYVAACYANGIVSGYNATTYGAGDPVTAVQAASMMMRALGYFQHQTDYRDGFELSTVRQASKISLFKDVNAAGNNAALTRNQVAQLALNTLETGMVEAKDNTMNITSNTGNGTISVTGGQVDYVYVTGDSSKAWTTAIDDVSATSIGTQNDSMIIELGEKLFNGDLVRREPTDDFGRPAIRWTYKGDEIGVYAKTGEKALSSTKKVTLNDLYNLIGGSNVDNLVSQSSPRDPDLRNQLVVYQDGVIISTDGKAGVKTYFDRNSSNGAQSGKGVLTEVFRDNNNNITIVYTNTYVAQATDDYNSGKGNVSVTLLTSPTGDASQVRSYSDWSAFNDLADDEFEQVKDIKEDDYILYTYARNKVQSIAKAEVLTGEVTAYSAGVGKTYGNAGGFVTITGDQHDYAKFAETDASNGCASAYTVGVEAAVVVDKDGYVVYVDEITASAGNYVYVDAISTQNGLSETVIVDGYFTDGTNDTLTVNKMYNAHAGSATEKNATTHELNLNLVKTTGRQQDIRTGDYDPDAPDATKITDIRGWYRYSKNSSGKYTLTLATTSNQLGATPTIKPNNISLGAGGGITYTANNNTIYVVKDKDNKVTAYTGVANSPEVTAWTTYGTGSYAFAMCSKNDTAKSASLVFIDVGDNGSVKGTAQDTLIYVLKSVREETTSTDNEPVYVWDVVMDGAQQTIKTTENDWAAGQMRENYYKTNDDLYEQGDTFDAWVGTGDVDKYQDKLTASSINWDAGRFTIGSLDTGTNGWSLAKQAANNSTHTSARSLQVLDDHTHVTLVLLPSEASGNTASQLRRDIMTDWAADWEIYESAKARTVANKLKNYQVTGEAYVVYNDATENDLADEIFVVVTSVNNPGNTNHTASIATGTSSVTKDASSTYTGTVDSITVSANDITVAATGPAATNGDTLVLNIDPSKVTGSANKYKLTLTHNGTTWTGDTSVTVTAADNVTAASYSVVVNITPVKTDTEKLDDGKAALPDAFKMQAGDPPADVKYEALNTAKTDIQAALAAKLTDTGAEIDDTAAGDDDGTVDGFKWAQTTAFAAGTIAAEAGTDGVYTVTVFLKAGSENSSKDVTVTVPARAYKDTTAGQAAQAIVNGLANVTVTATDVTWVADADTRDATATATAIATGLVTDATTAINGENNKDKVDITAVLATQAEVEAAGKTWSAYEAPQGNAAGGADGSIWMKLTYAYKDGGDTSTTVLATQVVKVTLKGEP